MEQYQEYLKLEGKKDIIEMLEFLINDQAFNTDFIVTLILNYKSYQDYKCSKKEEKKSKGELK